MAKKAAKEWFKRAQKDIQEAEFLFKNNRPLENVCLFIPPSQKTACMHVNVPLSRDPATSGKCEEKTARRDVTKWASYFCWRDNPEEYAEIIAGEFRHGLRVGVNKGITGMPVGLFSIQQAVEKYLKGFLIYHGWELKKIHDLISLLGEVVKIDKEFGRFSQGLQIISKYYIDSRYPLEYITEYTRKEVKSSLEIAREIINLIDEKLGLK